MTRVEETHAGVTVISKEPRLTFNETTGNLGKVPKSPYALKRRRIIGKVILGAVLLMCLLGGSQKAWAQPPTLPTVKVSPLVTQPEGIVTLTFSKAVTVTLVKIGTTDAPLLSPTAGVASIKVKVPQLTPSGTQGIEVALTEGTTSSTINDLITVAPLVTGLQASKDAKVIETSRGAVEGGETIIKFSGNIPSEIRQGLKVKIVKNGDTPDTAFNAKIVDIQNDYLVVEVPDVDETSYKVGVYVDDTPLNKKLELKVIHISSVYWWSSLILLGLILIIYLLYKVFYKIPAGQTRYSFLTMLLLEQENMTYSLSRAQFLGWLTVIMWAFLFFYIARGYVEQKWDFPNLGNVVYTFLISLGTLVVAQATNTGQGSKGAGEVHPSLADLVVHGGVLALDRVQQVVWTLLAIGMFLRNTVTSYDTASALPDIPQELLVLMGLSSAGYLGGKLVRGPGPIIQQVTLWKDSANLKINIKGKHLSKDGFVWLDGVKQPKDNIEVKADDLDSPLQYAKELEIKLAMTLDDWRKKDHAMTFVNDDAQRADWRTGPEINEVIPGAVEGGKVLLTIKGARLAKGATLEITGAPPDAKPVQDENDPNLFTVKVDPDWPSAEHELIVTSNGQKSLYTYKPPS